MKDTEQTPAVPGISALHLLKLSVGSESVADLEAWQRHLASRQRAAGMSANPRHVTRMWPRREAELLAGGSLYWVIKGLILVRQRILALEPVTDADGIRRCAIVLDPTLVKTETRPRKPFQGWRYLQASDAPPDLGGDGGAGGLPDDLEMALSALGLRKG